VAEAQLEGRSNIVDEVRREVSVDDVFSYKPPLECFYIGEDPINSRFAFFLSTILLSVYDQTPDVLRENSVNALGLEPIKLDFSNPLHIRVIYSYRRVLTTKCSLCPHRGWCPWLTVLELLGKPSKKQ